MSAIADKHLGSAREVALRVVHDVFGKPPRGAREALDYRLRRSDLDARDRAFATSLAYGAIRMRRRLDYELAPFVRDRMPSLPWPIAELLRLGTFQLRFQSGVAPHAAVSESVTLALRYGHKGTAGLVNAVLRRVAEAPQRAIDGDDDDALAVGASLPTWLVAHWRERFGAVLLPEILAGINADAPAGLSVDLRRATRDEVRAALAAAGIDARDSLLARDVVVIDAATPAERILDAVGERAELHAEAASVPVDLLDPHPGARVLEACSGRGNKTLQIAARIGADGEVLAVDTDARKTAVARQRLLAAGAANIDVQTADVTALSGPADRTHVLVDAPCSGLGIVGRQPEARWRKAPEDADRLAPLQRSILAAAAQRVAPGGRLVYAVCTTDRRESEDVVDGLLAERAGIHRAVLPERYAPLATTAGDVLIPPGVAGRDGFYVAVLERG